MDTSPDRQIPQPDDSGPFELSGARNPSEARPSEPPEVSVKDRRNFCDYFTLNEGKRAAAGKDRAAEARRKLEELFKK